MNSGDIRVFLSTAYMDQPSFLYLPGVVFTKTDQTIDNIIYLTSFFSSQDKSRDGYQMYKI